MKTIHETFCQELSHAGFAGDISTEQTILERHATDESIFRVTPEVIITPHNTLDIQKAVSLVSELYTKENPIHLTPRAAGTGLSGGSLNDSIVIDTTTHLNTLHSHSKTDNGEVVYEVDPGIMYRDLEKVMDQDEVYIPSFPASKDLCTVGGMVANNSAGPDTFSFGHTASYVEQIEVVLSDAERYTVKPLEWTEFEQELSRSDHLGVIYRHIWELLLHHEEQVLSARPHTAKNSAGYALWDAVSTTVEEFMKGRGVFDLTQVFSGSQGTLGIITRIWIRAIKKPANTSLLSIPIYDLDTVGAVITDTSREKPINIELFDGPSYQAALDHSVFFKDRLPTDQFKAVTKQMRTILRKRFGKQIPHFVLLVTLDSQNTKEPKDLVDEINQKYHTKAWLASSLEAQALWQVRRASYSLSKFADPHKRPAAFLEDMTVEPDQIGEFFTQIQKLFAQYEVQAFVHGHGGNGHLHFYPLLDFTDPNTAKLVENMARDFFKTATNLGGNICGEHNDGIIRTPYLDQMFDPQTLEIFETLEQVCDPKHIFNPGKKVNPRFSIKQYIRHTN